MANPAFVGMVLIAGLMIKGAVTGRLRAPEPDIDDVLPTGDTLNDIYSIDDIDDDLIGQKALLKVAPEAEDDSTFVVPEPRKRSVYPNVVNYEAVEAATEARRIVWDGRQIFFNLPQTYLQYYDNATESSQKIDIADTAQVLNQPLRRCAVDAHVKVQPAEVVDDGTLVSAQSSVGSLSGRQDDTTVPRELALVLHRPLCIPLPVGYRKFYVTAAGVAYEIVGRPIPKRRTRRGKKKRTPRPDADGENKENVGKKPQEKVKVNQLPPSRPALATLATAY
ncbi:hypothetical protein EIP91_002526 [Steccherinum ochraceum]|uniref:Uncharacterized protein n=1 Tax=Steccherinum ochraceum TaxID=92696 RepID=A0A4R0RNS2_9APHY|nr:hypothetical protein EIP91_002526 [Steccherinum ochraceum]